MNTHNNGTLLLIAQQIGGVRRSREVVTLNAATA